MEHAARQEGVDRSEFMRIAIEYALQNMPIGWRPDASDVDQ